MEYLNVSKAYRFNSKILFFLIIHIVNHVDIYSYTTYYFFGVTTQSNDQHISTNNEI